MGEIVGFTGETILPIDPDKVLQAAVGQYPNGVLVIGWNADEDLAYASSLSSAQELIWLLKCAERGIMEMADA